MKCMIILVAALAVVAAQSEQSATSPKPAAAPKLAAKPKAATLRRPVLTKPKQTGPTLLNRPLIFSTLAPSVAPSLAPSAAPSLAPIFIDATAAPSPSQAPILLSTPEFSILRRPYSTPAPILAYRSNLDDKNAQLLSYENEINPDGSFRYSYAIDNGIAAAAEGRLVDVYGDKELASEAIQGSFSWGYPDGSRVSIGYVADENGYQPQGDALPTPPPIPPLIARALEWTARRLSERRIVEVNPSVATLLA